MSRAVREVSGTMLSNGVMGVPGLIAPVSCSKKWCAETCACVYGRRENVSEGVETSAFRFAQQPHIALKMPWMKFIMDPTWENILKYG